MANKISNEHLETLLKCKKYNTPDVFIALIDISKEFKDPTNGSIHFLIQTDCDSEKLLKKIIYKRVPYVCKQTITHCIKELKEIGLLTYNKSNYAWEIPNMINFLNVGYTKVRDIFFDAFKNFTLNEKKIMLYISQLFDSPKHEEFKKTYNVDVKIVLDAVSYKKSNNDADKEDIENKEIDTRNVWLKLLNTHSVYYARKVIIGFLSKTKNLVQDVSNTLCSFHPIKKTKFTFLLNAPNLKKTNPSLTQEIERNKEDYEVVKYLVDSYGLKGYVKDTHIMQIIRAISGLRNPVLKEHVVKCILNKKAAYHLRGGRKEDIKSIPAYAIAIIKSIVQQFINHLKRYKIGQKQSAKLTQEDLNTFIDIDNISVKIKDIIYDAA